MNLIYFRVNLVWVVSKEKLAPKLEFATTIQAKPCNFDLVLYNF